MNMTPWFHPHIKPVRIGEYEVINEGILAWWNGTEWSWWYFSDDTVASKEFHRKHIGAIEKINWRGLAKEPK